MRLSGPWSWISISSPCLLSSHLMSLPLTSSHNWTKCIKNSASSMPFDPPGPSHSEMCTPFLTAKSNATCGHVFWIVAQVMTYLEATILIHLSIRANSTSFIWIVLDSLIWIFPWLHRHWIPLDQVHEDGGVLVSYHHYCFYSHIAMGLDSRIK